jgi:SAM-dependent methyltransferase
MFVQALDRRFYPGVENNWDNLLFRNFILERLRKEHVLLDLGAGAGVLEHMNFRGLAARVYGIDPNPRVTSNPYLDEAKIGTGEQLPYSDSTFDVVVSANVLEHLTEPEKVFAEIARVLKPGGVFLFKTPNRRHYMPLIARMTPHWFHEFYNKLRGRAEEDTFPTTYLSNTPERIAAVAQATGLQVGELKLVEGRPEYLRVLALAYLVGILYERLVNAVDAFKRYRILIVGELRKPVAV